MEDRNWFTDEEAEAHILRYCDITGQEDPQELRRLAGAAVLMLAPPYLDGNTVYFHNRRFWVRDHGTHLEYCLPKHQQMIDMALRLHAIDMRSNKARRIQLRSWVTLQGMMRQFHTVYPRVCRESSVEWLRKYNECPPWIVSDPGDRADKHAYY